MRASGLLLIDCVWTLCRVWSKSELLVIFTDIINQCNDQTRVQTHVHTSDSIQVQSGLRLTRMNRCQSVGFMNQKAPVMSQWLWGADGYDWTRREGGRGGGGGLRVSDRQIDTNLTNWRVYACPLSGMIWRKAAQVIALWLATNRWYVVKCVSQKRNWSTNKNQWYSILVTFIYKFNLVL